jgi:hypothetical protein
MSEMDKILLDIYMEGFSDELDGKKERNYKAHYEMRAYNLGRLDALVGDDCRSVDYQSNEQILEKIKK